MKKKLSIIVIIICFVATLFFCLYEKSRFNEIKEIKKRGVLTVGTTGDYCPMTYFDSETNTYVGFDIALAKDLAKSLDVKIQFVPTSWQTLMKDTEENKFDIAISGITVTDARKEQALMTKGYLKNGKTVLCRKEDEKKYTSLAEINHPEVRVMENPGGLNEKFAKENLPYANLIIHDVNYEIPGLIAEGEADVMITEIIEANYYSHINKKLAAPVTGTPFTQGQIGMLLPKENKNLLKYANEFIEQEQTNGRIEELKKQYIYTDKPLINNKL